MIKVIIIGAGFGGLEAARKLQKLPIDLTIIDKNNYHLFQPLLYQVATAGLSPADIALPPCKLYTPISAQLPSFRPWNIAP